MKKKFTYVLIKLRYNKWHCAFLQGNLINKFKEYNLVNTTSNINKLF